MAQNGESVPPRAVESRCAPGIDLKAADRLRQHVRTILGRLRQRQRAEQGSVMREAKSGQSETLT
jgi:hypothetical protein